VMGRIVHDITLRTFEATILCEWQYPVVIDDINNANFQYLHIKFSLTREN